MNERGDILGIKSPANSMADNSVIALQSIPLEAYKTGAIASDIETQFQLTAKDQHISFLEDQTHQLRIALKDAQANATQRVDPEVVQRIQAQSSQQTDQIRECEQVIEQNQSEIRDLQLMLTRKVEPDVYAQLQQQTQNQSDQLVEFEQEIHQLREQLVAAESQQIPLEEYDKLNQLSSEQSQTIAGLEERIQQLQSELESSHRQMDGMVDGVLFHGLEQKNHGLEQKNQSDVALIQGLEAQVTRLTHDVDHWSQAANTKVELETFQTLETTSQAQAEHALTLQQQIQALQQELSECKHVVDRKIDPAEHEAALERIQSMEIQLSQSWFQRCKAWIQRD